MERGLILAGIGCAVASVLLLLLGPDLAHDTTGLRQGMQLSTVCLLALGAALAGTGLLLKRASARDEAPAAPAATPRTALRTTGWALTGVLALAAVLRAIGLDSGLWYDEIVTLVEFVRPPTSQTFLSYIAMNNHILFTLCAQGVIAVFGESAWTLRLPAVGFGVAGIWALWRLGLQVVDRRQALLAALVLAVSYHHVWFSQNARGYTGLLLWTLIATSVFLHGLRHGGRRVWIGYAFLFAVAMYTHLTAGFVFAGHGVVYLFLFLRRRMAARPEGDDPVDPHPGARSLWPLLGFALGGLITLQLYSLLLPQIVQAFGRQAGEQSANVKVAEWRNPLWTAVEMIRGLRLGIASGAGIAVAALLSAVGVVSFARRHPVFTALVVVPVPVTLAALLVLEFHIWPRYFFIDLGFVVLALVHGTFVTAGFLAGKLDAERRWRAGGQQLGTALVIVMAAGSALSLGANYRVPKQDYAAVQEFVKSQRGPDDAVVTAGLASLPYDRYLMAGWTSVESVAELDAIRSRSRHTWLVYSFRAHMEAAHPDILDRADSTFELVRQFPGTVGGGTIYVFRSVEP